MLLKIQHQKALVRDKATESRLVADFTFHFTGKFMFAFSMMLSVQWMQFANTDPVPFNLLIALKALRYANCSIHNAVFRQLLTR